MTDGSILNASDSAIIINDFKYFDGDGSVFAEFRGEIAPAKTISSDPASGSGPNSINDRLMEKRSLLLQAVLRVSTPSGSERDSISDRLMETRALPLAVLTRPNNFSTAWEFSPASRAITR